jgi:hypothetical protein
VQRNRPAQKNSRLRFQELRLMIQTHMPSIKFIATILNLMRELIESGQML